MLIRAFVPALVALLLPLPLAGQDAASEPPVVLAAGDIARCAILGGAVATARVLDRFPDATVLTLGDHAYDAGTAQEFAQCYAPTWGRHKGRTRPVPGNHDLLTDKGKAFYEYFGERAGTPFLGYYSFELGTWHIIGLNSFLDAGPNSPQFKWLKEDLAAHPADCILAYWHIPVFSSGPHGSDPHMRPAWQLLRAAAADIVLNGHDHDYERFAPQDENGRATPSGIREFVVGTGGGGVYKFKTPVARSEVRDNTTYGVMKLTLKPGSYDWEFIPGSGTFTDKGSGECTPKP